MFWAPAGGAWGLCFLSCVLRMYLGYATFTKYMFYSTCSSVLYAEAERGLPRRKCLCDRIYVCSSLGRLFHLTLPRCRVSLSLVYGSVRLVQRESLACCSTVSRSLAALRTAGIMVLAGQVRISERPDT